MARTEFQMAVDLAEEDEEAPEDVDYNQEFGFGSFVLHTRLPTPAENLAFVARGTRGGGGYIRAVWGFLERVCDPVDFQTLDRYVEEGRISYDLLYGGDEQNSHGVIDMLIERASANPSPAPSASTRSQSSGGQRSTGRSPGRGSTRSS